MMRDTRTSSAQTVGCGHTEIQQGLPVKQDYRVQRVAGDTAGLPVTEKPAIPTITGKKAATVNKSSEHSRSTGYRVLPVTEKSAVPILTGKKPASNPVLN